ncbi:hypothetical protein EV702DRAFT_1090519 [Suillus placidus]|uniref:Uncharacterized protein n=1 Tax=Suillus placidus TaxID=48579 RepID=A0A9P7D4T8_9AGAM|nr:hypothetical protein EV702DRAFT_1090519 [Suillus placidus]
MRSDLLPQTSAGALENKIHEITKERMAPFCFLFKQLGSKNIVLGGFGIGAYRNNVTVVFWERILSVRSRVCSTTRKARLVFVSRVAIF